MTTPSGDANHPTDPIPRWVEGTARGGTVLIALGAFWLSFTALTDLATMAGISPVQAWVWPLIVDGVILVATISVVALSAHGRRATVYPWSLLILGSAVSIAGNAAHAVLTDAGRLPVSLSGVISAIPPLVLLAITHLTVELTRRTTTTGLAHTGTNSQEARAPRSESERAEDAAAADHMADGPVHTSRNTQIGRAKELQGQGWPNKRIAADIGVHPSTIGRWLSTLSSDH